MHGFTKVIEKGEDQKREDYIIQNSRGIFKNEIKKGDSTILFTGFSC